MLSRGPECLNQASCHPPDLQTAGCSSVCGRRSGFFFPYHVSTDSDPTPAHRAPSSVCTAGCFPAGRGLKLTLAICYIAPRLRMHEAAPPPTYALLICCCIKHNFTFRRFSSEAYWNCQLQTTGPVFSKSLAHWYISEFDVSDRSAPSGLVLSKRCCVQHISSFCRGD